MKETEQPWLQWLKGRQNSGYEKMILFINKKVVPFDLHILKYLKGSFVPEHTDYEPGYRHYRLNIILRQPLEGGKFVCQDPIITSRWVNFFRSDRPHSVSKIRDGSRYVFSIGVCIPRLKG